MTEIVVFILLFGPWIKMLIEIKILCILESEYYIRKYDDPYKVKACDFSILILTDHVTCRKVI